MNRFHVLLDVSARRLYYNLVSIQMDSVKNRRSVNERDKLYDYLLTSNMTDAP